jgi:hypothetical protein
VKNIVWKTGIMIRTVNTIAEVAPGKIRNCNQFGVILEQAGIDIVQVYSGNNFLGRAVIGSGSQIATLGVRDEGLSRGSGCHIYTPRDCRYHDPADDENYLVKFIEPLDGVEVSEFADDEAEVIDELYSFDELFSSMPGQQG